MKIATAAYPLDWFEDFAEYEAKLAHWVAGAAGNGADLLVFPEYGAMELASLDGADVASDMEAAMLATARHIPAADALHVRLAREHGVHILAASGPVYAPGPRPVNRARFFGPDGQCEHQDKQIMTLFERDPMDVQSAAPLKVFDTRLGRIGILICYDAEFPSLARALVEAGAEILLAPSFTEQLSGYWRVRIGAMARALEGQCVSVHAPCVGSGSGCPAMGASSGAAAVYGPPDIGFPESGVLAEGEMNAPGWVYADVPDGAVANVRANGRVRNFTHWVEQASCVKTLEFINFRGSELENPTETSHLTGAHT
ncbi:MAG: carbon-nitrogen hydrolase family protein [Rhodobacter sp.]|nr:carbon-nitrogen hydrolase family protein [Rhodobacter sp.]